MIGGVLDAVSHRSSVRAYAQTHALGHASARMVTSVDWSLGMFRPLQVLRLHLLAALALCVLAWPASACINEFATNRQGHTFMVDEPVGERLVETLTTNSRVLDDGEIKHIRALAKAVRTQPGFENRNDLGVVLIRYGRTTDAIRLFLANERDFPGRYQTATNLGTALELAGFDAVALRWIRIGMQRNPQAHRGTEWLHARILEAKLAQARDRAWLQSHSVAGVAFAPVALPPLPQRYPAGNDRRPVHPAALHQALYYQLSERLAFVRPTDPVVANLLQDWATLNLAGGPLQNADALYGLAERYGAAQAPLTRKRREAVRALLARKPSESNDNDTRCPICVIPDPAYDPAASGP
jgi:hypothetical protein